MRARTRVCLAVAATVAVGVSLATPTSAGPSSVGRKAQTVEDIEFLGEAIVPTGTMFDGTEVGGLSSITYDQPTRTYHAVSDDQGNRQTGDPVRYYSLTIDLDDGRLDDGDVAFVKVTQLWEKGQKTPFPPGGVDPEGFVLAKGGIFYMSSEGNVFAEPIVEPFIMRYNKKGRATTSLPIPDHYVPNGVDHGVRFNLAFESLNLTPNRRRLVTAGEGALFQDGPASTFENGSFARILEYHLPKKAAHAEFVYEVGPWAEPSAIFGVNGIVEVLPIDNVGTMLVMERSFSVGGILGGGTGNVVVLNQISTEGATDVLHLDSLYKDGAPRAITPVSQVELFAFDELGVPIDNVEGMTFGPDLPDGRRTLVVVSDNNFSPGQFTQFMVFALDIQPVP